MSVTDEARPSAKTELRHARVLIDGACIGREFSLEGMLDSFTQRKNVTVNLNTPRRS
jgi:hypothetical protein